MSNIIDIKLLIDRLNKHCTNCLREVALFCVSKTHYDITVEHFLIKLLDYSDSDFDIILKYFSINTDQLNNVLIQSIKNLKRGNTFQPLLSPLLVKWFEEAWLIGSINYNETSIRSGFLLIAFFNKQLPFINDQYQSIFNKVDFNHLTSEFINIVKDSIEHIFHSEQIEDGDQKEQRIFSGSALDKFCIDFTQKAKKDEIDPVFGRDTEIYNMIQILARRRKNNPIIVGEVGVGKTAIVEGLALRIINNDVPDFLQNFSLLSLDIGLLQAGAGVRGEFENRLKSVINEIKSSVKPIILFVDEAHTLVGAGGSPGGTDAANLLKPALARGELRTIAATTWSEYKQYFEKDPALKRRFQPVKLDEPSIETTTLILRGLKEKYEKSHEVVISDQSIKAAAELSNRYISGRFLPDKAIDVIDTGAARVKVFLSAKPELIENKERYVRALQREQNALICDKSHNIKIDENRLTEIDELINSLTNEIEVITKKWTKEQNCVKKIFDLRKQIKEQMKENNAVNELNTLLIKTQSELNEIQGDSPLMQTEVDYDVVAKIISDWTGIPLGDVKEDEEKNIVELETNLKKIVKGQDHAIETIVNDLIISKSSLQDLEKPLGVYLLVGPGGVGKTETGLAISDLLFGGKRFAVTLNMSEFHQKHTASRLIGSPPGFVGYGKGGLLTEAIRKRPYSAILIEEAEKAHIEVLNLFSQVFDKGVLTDSEGNIVNFKNTIIFLTTNIAEDIITEFCANEDSPSTDDIISAIEPVLNKKFQGLLKCIKIIVPFLSLGKSTLIDITTSKLNIISKRLQKNHNVSFSYSQNVVEQIAKRCLEVATGARKIDNILNESILPLISKKILLNISNDDTPRDLRIDLDKNCEFQINTADNFFNQEKK